MGLPVATKNSLLNGLVVDHMSLHIAFPGTIGANEVTGGSYVRQTLALPTSSGGMRYQPAPTAFSVPACTVPWIGLWAGSVFVAAIPNGGFTPRNYMAIATSDTIYCASHGYNNGDKITFYQGTPPGGITEGMTVYARDVATDTFKVAATSGGLALDLTSSSSFGCIVSRITEDVFATPGSESIPSVTITVPD